MTLLAASAGLGPVAAIVGVSQLGGDPHGLVEASTTSSITESPRLKPVDLAPYREA